MKSDARAFAEAISALLGPQDSIRVLNATRPGLPPVCCFIFQNRPEPDLMTVVTYGLSLSNHADWPEEKPELISCVQSSDEEWGLALAGFAERLRGEESFADGSILMSEAPIAADSEMCGFLLGDQLTVAAESAVIELPTRKVRLRGAFPIHDCETEFIGTIGASEFLQRPGVNLRDVQRLHIWE